MATNSTVIGLIRVLLSMNSGEFEATLKRTRSAAKAWSKDLASVGRQAQTLGSNLTRTLTLPIAGAGVAMAKFAIDFESSFAGVRKTVDATEAEFASMAQGFRDLSKTIPVNVNELNRLGEAAGALGIPTQQVVDFARVMAELGVTTNLTADQAAESIAKIQNIFGAAGKDTERFASALVALGKDGASTESQILDMATRIAGAGHVIGITQPQVLAIASALSSVGIEAEAGGTAISRVMVDIANAVANGGEKLEGFARVAGMSGAAFAKAFKTDAAGALVSFIEGLGKVKEQGENTFKVLEDLGQGNIRVRTALLNAAGAGDLMRKALERGSTAWRENTALAETAAARFDTTAARLTILWNRIKDVGITLGNALKPGIETLISLADRLLPLVNQLADGFAKLPGPIQATAIGAAALAAAAGPLIYAFGQLSLSASAISGAFATSGLATKAATAVLGVLGTTAGTVAAGVAALGGVILGTRAALGSWTETLEVAVVPFAGLLKLVRALTDAIGLHSQVLTDVVRIVDDLFVLSLRELQKALGVTLDAVATFGKGVVSVMRAVASDVAEQVQRLVPLIAGVLPGSMQVALAALVALGGKLPNVGEALHSTADALDKIVAAGKKLAKTVEEDVGKPLGDLTATTNRTTGAFEDLGGDLEGLGDPLKQFVKNAQSLEAQLAAAYRAGVPMPILLEEFKSQIEEVTHKAPIFGHAVGAATQKAADALKKADLATTILKANTALSAEARQAFDALQRESARSANAFPAELRKTNEAVLQQLTGLQRDAIGLEQDSIEARLKLVHVEYEQKRTEVRAFAGPFMDEQLALIDQQERQASQDATQAWRDHVADLKREVLSYPDIFQQALSGVPGLLQQAFTGGGGIGGAGKAILSGFGGLLGGKAFGSLAAHLNNTFAKTFGVGVTSKLGALIPGIGAALGSALGPLFGGVIDHFFGTAGRDAIKDFAHDLTGSSDLNQLHVYLQKVFNPAEAEEYWKLLTQGTGRNNAKQAAANIEKVKKAIAAAQQETQAFNASLGGMLQQIQALGGTLPKTLRDYLTELAQSGKLSDDNLALLQQLSGDGEIAWQTVQAAVERYGGSIKDLGGSFQKARLHDAWQQVIDDVDLFTRAGVSAGDILHLTQDKIIELVQQSARFGTEIPENMRPWIQKLIASGKLLDENGHKITDINQLTFGETLQTTLQTLNGSLQELITLFRGIPNAVRAIPKSVDIDVNVRRRDSSEDTERLPLSTGGIVPRYLAAGSSLASAFGFKPRGTDTIPAMLTPGELVLTEAQQGRLAQSIAAGMAALDRLDALRFQPPSVAKPSDQIVRDVVEARHADPATGESTTIQIVFQDGAFRAVDTDGLRQMITDKALPVIVEAMRENRRGVRTDFRHAIGVTG